MKKPNSSIALRAVENVLTRLGGKVAADVCKEFTDQRQNEAEDLYNSFVEAINDRKPSVETVLYVIKRLEFSMLLGNTSMPPAPAEEAKPEKYVAKTVKG